MDETNNRAKRIEQKLQLLLANHQQAQKEILRLQKENAGLKAELNTLDREIGSLEQQANAREMSGLTPDDQAKKNLEKKINNYLKDIEKCLALLSAS